VKLKPYKEMIKMSKEKLDSSLAGVRAMKAKRQAELEMAKLDETIVVYEAEINEICCQKDVNFASIISKLDQMELAKRKKKQYAVIIDQMFPADDSEE